MRKKNFVTLAMQVAAFLLVSVLVAPAESRVRSAALDLAANNINAHNPLAPLWNMKPLAAAAAVASEVATGLGEADVPDCSEFDASRIKLVTFDVFAALMDTFVSMKATVQQALPRVPTATVERVVDEWLDHYSSYKGFEFDQTVTGPQPFRWVVESSLTALNTTHNLQLSQHEYDQLITTWGQLTPWPKTKEVLQALAKTGRLIAPLSNGDVNTLAAATAVFLPEVKMSHIFSSDFPVGVFKPHAGMYLQVFRELHGITHKEHLHIAGSRFDADGARKAGMFAGLLYDTPLAITGPNAPCFVFKNVTELLPVFSL